jgi:hypothetical protein
MIVLRVSNTLKGHFSGVAQAAYGRRSPPQNEAEASVLEARLSGILNVDSPEGKC